MDNSRVALEYFRAFSEKRIDQLDYMFHDDIELIDWDNHVQGKTEVLAFNLALFQSVKRLEVYIDQLADANDKLFAQIKVIVDSTVLDVIDVLTIVNGKIKQIQAYKQ